MCAFPGGVGWGATATPCHSGRSEVMKGADPVRIGQGVWIIPATEATPM
jgi:hypothetical protein